MPSHIPRHRPTMRLCRATVLASVLAGASSCQDVLGCGDDVQWVSFSTIDANAYTSALVLWPSDAFILTATAGSGKPDNEFCPAVTRYTSSVNPEQFEYFTSDSSVAKISSSGVVIAVALGTAKIYAKSNHVATQNPISVTVAAPIAQMHYTANPPVGKVGDTVVVT